MDGCVGGVREEQRGGPVRNEQIGSLRGWVRMGQIRGGRVKI